MAIICTSCHKYTSHPYGDIILPEFLGGHVISGPLCSECWHGTLDCAQLTIRVKTLSSIEKAAFVHSCVNAMYGAAPVNVNTDPSSSNYDPLTDETYGD
jgi:hypothetical protein